MKNVNIFVRCRQHERKFSLPFFCFRYILLLEIGETAKAKARFFTEKCLIFQHKGLPSRVVTGGAYEQQTHPARHRGGDRRFDGERLDDPQRQVARALFLAARGQRPRRGGAHRLPHAVGPLRRQADCHPLAIGLQPLPHQDDHRHRRGSARRRVSHRDLQHLLESPHGEPPARHAGLLARGRHHLRHDADPDGQGARAEPPRAHRRRRRPRHGLRHRHRGRGQLRRGAARSQASPTCPRRSTSTTSPVCAAAKGCRRPTASGVRRAA